MRGVILIIMMLSLNRYSYGNHREVEVRTQVNKQTDLFEKSVGDYRGFESDLLKEQEGIVEGVKSKKGLEDLAVFAGSGGESGGISGLEIEAQRLGNLSDKDLTNNGRNKMMEEGIIEEIYVDYSSSLNKQYLKDAKKIGDAQNNLFKVLLGKMKELGVDCRTVKGSVEKEPVFYLAVEEESHLDTEYNKTMCEELRNSYACRDRLSVRCVRRGRRFDPWEARELEMGAYEIWNHHRDWVESVFWKSVWKRSKYKGVIGWGAVGSIRNHIASSLNVRLDQIEYRGAYNVGDNLMDWPEDKFRMYPAYRIKYGYRNTEETCEEWRKSWDEECRLNGANRYVNPERMKGKRSAN